MLTDAVRGKREPVETLKDRGDVVWGVGVGEVVYGRTLDRLEFIEGFERCTMKDAIAVVESGCNRGTDKGFSSRERSNGRRQAMLLQWKGAVLARRMMCSLEERSLWKIITRGYRVFSIFEGEVRNR